MTFTYLPRTRKAAIAAGSHRYFTGVPCKHGHITARFTDSCGCCACNTANSRNYSKRIRETRQANDAGFKSLKVMVHPDDAANVEAHCAALRIARGML